MARTMLKLGNYIKVARESLNLTQDEAAKRVGISRVSYIAIENNKTVPHPKTIQKLSVGLNLPLEKLIKVKGKN